MIIYSPTFTAARDFSMRRVDRLHRHTEEVGKALVKNKDSDNKFDKHYQNGMLLTLRSEEHTSELQSLMRISYAVFCLKKKKNNNIILMTSHPEYLNNVTHYQSNNNCFTSLYLCTIYYDFFFLLNTI